MFIGKWNKSGEVISVQQHLSDTGGVMKHLLHHIVPQQTIEASGCSEQEFRALAIFCSLVHDIGKCVSSFQYKTKNREKLLVSGFVSDYADATPHALAGAAILNQIYEVPEEIADIIAAHHGRTRESGKQEKYENQLRKYRGNYITDQDEDTYRKVWNEIYENAIDSSEITAFPKIGIRAQILITGLVIIADWIASNETYFPYHVGNNQDQRVQAGLKKIDLPPFWKPNRIQLSASDFKSRFGFDPNQLQSSVLAIISNADSAGLMIIESTMGTGKTASALAASEVLSCFSGAGGVYFGLPTQATANGLFPRVISWAEKVSEGMTVSVRLAHGDAQNNDYYKDLSISDSSGITVNQWLSGGHRALLPDFVVGTVDQILMASLKQKFFMLLHLGMSGKTIIIDEVHSYDAYMDSFLDTILNWLGAYHIPVILLSATLTEDKRADFVKAYSGQQVTSVNKYYPSITWADYKRNTVFPVHLTSKDQTISIKYISDEELIYKVIESIKDGGCAGVIVNTVARAQLLMEKIQAGSAKNIRVILIHSRYLPEDRAVVENEIQRLVGKASGINERNGTIVIGTQVLEQSLDIDFDVLFTDICPIDLLFQRMGRLHRHRIHDSIRPYNWQKAVCFAINSEKKSIYEEYIIRRTKETLKPYITLPADIKPMIESVYDLRQGSDGKDKEKYKQDIQEMQIHAKDFILPNPSKCRKYKGLTEEIHNMESVRYRMNNLTYLLVKRDNNGNYMTFHGNPISREPSPDEQAMISRQKIRLYDTKELDDAVKNQKKPDWSNHFYEDLLVVDSNGNACLNSMVWNYSSDFGLRRIN